MYIFSGLIKSIYPQTHANLCVDKALSTHAPKEERIEEGKGDNSWTMVLLKDLQFLHMDAWLKHWTFKSPQDSSVSRGGDHHQIERLLMTRPKLFTVL